MQAILEVIGQEVVVHSKEAPIRVRQAIIQVVCTATAMALDIACIKVAAYLAAVHMVVHTVFTDIRLEAYLAIVQIQAKHITTEDIADTTIVQELLVLDTFGLVVIDLAFVHIADMVTDQVMDSTTEELQGTFALVEHPLVSRALQLTAIHRIRAKQLVEVLHQKPRAPY